MTCTYSSVLTESYEEPALGSATGADSIAYQTRAELRRRRHSSYHAGQWSLETDNVQVLVDRFLTELGRRLDFLDAYGHLDVDGRIERAWSTLHQVRESCSRVSDAAWDAGRRRASILVETVEERYNDALARTETLEAKVQAGVKMMEEVLADFEARAYAMRDSAFEGIMAADLLDEGWRVMDDNISRAKTALDGGIQKARNARKSLIQSVEIHIERALLLAKENGLITYHELPVPWRTNPHIIRGYRFHVQKTDCLRSLFSVHNELLNIWTHAVGLVLVAALAFHFYPTSPLFSLSTKTDVVIAGVFFLAAAKCLLCSIMWHTFNSISQQSVMERFACVDYTGISLLVGASIMTTQYCAFYCEPVPRRIYLLATGASSLAGSILPWNPTFNRPDMAWARVGFYIALAATGFIPVFQLAHARSWTWAWHFYSPITMSLVVYVLGACVYAAKVPERWCPGGITDFVGSSHNWWHVAVIGGILFHFVAMQRFFGEAFERARLECSVS